MNVKLKPSEKIRILNSTDLYTVMRGVLLREQKIDRDKEHFWIMGLAANNTLLYVELISLGSKRGVVVDPMEVFSVALQKRTVKVVLVHNHPSGGLEPSPADKDITDHMIQVGAFLNTPVLDDMIITPKGYYSFLASGLLAELRRSKKYVLPYKEKERLQVEALAKGHKAGKAEGIKAGEAKGREAVALALKAKGVAVGVIAEATGLSVAKVKGLKT